MTAMESSVWTALLLSIEVALVSLSATRSWAMTILITSSTHPLAALGRGKLLRRGLALSIPDKFVGALILNVSGDCVTPGLASLLHPRNRHSTIIRPHRPHQGLHMGALRCSSLPRRSAAIPPPQGLTVHGPRDPQAPRQARRRASGRALGGSNSSASHATTQPRYPVSLDVPWNATIAWPTLLELPRSASPYETSARRHQRDAFLSDVPLKQTGSSPAVLFIAALPPTPFSRSRTHRHATTQVKAVRQPATGTGMFGAQEREHKWYLSALSGWRRAGGITCSRLIRTADRRGTRP
ncbi:hypothetical protein C8Q76DRAFT_228479 [Earliella scabrosa]|nr:hypothetical protein C8Q76DRAFT_228479 [Earliella scabrosa]